MADHNGVSDGQEPQEEGREGANHFASLIMAGERFEGARLPVEALVELQRYRDLLLEAARNSWRAENPIEPVPDDFDKNFDLAITEVEEGSAESVLDHTKSAYDAYFDSGREELELLFANIIEKNFGTKVDSKDIASESSDSDSADYSSKNEHELNLEQVNRFASLISMYQFQEFGSSLYPEEYLEIPRKRTKKRLTISAGGWQAAIQPIVDVLSEDHHEEQISSTYLHLVSSVAGRLTALDADKQNFSIETLHFGSVNGRYKEETLTRDLKTVLDSNSAAPIIRISGRMSWKGDSLYRILEARGVELIEIDSDPWSTRILELISLAPGWDPEVPKSPVISFTSIDAAREILRSTQSFEPIPGIYPAVDGGVVVEWGTPERVVTLEISSEARFFFFHLDVGSAGVNEVETNNLEEVQRLVKEALIHG